MLFDLSKSYRILHFACSACGAVHSCICGKQNTEGETKLKMEAYKIEFIKFLESAGVLKFGDFTAKSGRKIPYFINALIQLNLMEWGYGLACHLYIVYGNLIIKS